MLETWILDIIKFTLPSIILLIGVVILINKMLDSNYRIKMLEYKNQTGQLFTPVRLQAYERLVTYLERISFANLIQQNYNQGQTVQQLHISLLIAIREEFNYNISQQLYVSNDVWQLVVTSKEEFIKVLNNTVMQYDAQEDAKALLEHLLSLNSAEGLLPNDLAINFLKEEIRNSF